MRILAAAGTTGAVVVVALLLTAALAPGLLAPGDPLAIAPAEAFRPPGAGHLLGTDESGRDVLTRVVHGAGRSLVIGVSATAIGLGLGAVLGLAAALLGRVADFAVNRVIEVVFAFPGLLLALFLIVILGPGIGSATLAVGVSAAPGYARIIRGRVMSVRRSPYVEAATVLGRPPLLLLARHILPNTAAPLFVLGTLGVGQAIVWASSLSYLGLGTVPPDPEWGAMLAAGRTYIGSAPWLTVVPGLMIVLTATASTVLGRALERRVRAS
ncbi:ABC transporter permease [Clavibacter sp. DM3]|nr:ABC transporter permease [Clavibacter zhangzhiyongii]